MNLCFFFNGRMRYDARIQSLIEPAMLINHQFANRFRSPSGILWTGGRQSKFSGFSLIELAVVLFIVTLALGGIMQFVNAQLANAKISNTRSKQDAIKTALVNFIARNNRLPCPAIATNPAGTPGEGYEAPTVGAVTCVGTTGSDAALSTFTIAAPLSSTPLVATGEVPWASLGLPRETSLDGYANRFTYQVTWQATQLNAQTIAGMTGVITLHDSSPVSDGSSSATPAGNQVNDCRPIKTVAYVTSANPCSAVVVILSHGPDGFGSYTDGGVQVQFPPAGVVPAADARENADLNQKFVAKTFSDSTTNPFDDMVFALTSSDLLSPLTNTAVLQDARAAINMSFSIIKNAIAGSIASGITGTSIIVPGNESLPACTPVVTGACATYTKYSYLLPSQTSPVAEASNSYSFTPPASCSPLPCTQNRVNISSSVGALGSSQARLDPWNREIQYVLFATPGTTTFTNPPTNANDAANIIGYRLLSLGPDGTANTADDIWVDVSFGEIRQQLPSR